MSQVDKQDAVRSKLPEHRQIHVLKAVREYLNTIEIALTQQRPQELRVWLYKRT